MKRSAVFAVTAVLATPALATNGMRVPGFGAVQSSMGGVGVGATLDAASMVSNPAGLADLGSRFDASVSVFIPSVEYAGTESPMPAGLEGAVIAQPDQTIESERGPSPIPFLGGVWALHPRLKIGLGVAGLAGMGVDYPANLYGGKTYTNYLNGRVTPSVGFRFNEMLAIGLTVNAIVAQMKYDVAQGFGQQLHDTATAFGIGATLGVKITPVPWLAVGAAYESKSEFQDFEFDIPAHNGVDPATFQPVPIPAGKDKLAFDQPQIATLGIAVAPADKLVVAADVQWIDWSSTNGANKPEFSDGGPMVTGSMAFNLGWKDQWVFKLGAQYEVMQGLNVRAGYNYSPQPLDENRAFENIAFPAVAEHHVSLGVGYTFAEWVSVHLGGMYAPKIELTGANATYPAQGGQAIASYRTAVSQIAIDAGLSFEL